jgi:DNA-binding IclR family transcriptional regulator
VLSDVALHHALRQTLFNPLNTCKPFGQDRLQGVQTGSKLQSSPGMKRKQPTPSKAAKEDLLSCGFHVLSHLLDGSPSRGLTHIAAEMGLAKSTTHRILKILMRLGFVEQSSLTRQYYVSPLLFQFMHKVIEMSYPNRKLNDLLIQQAQLKNATYFLSALSGKITTVIATAGRNASSLALGQTSEACVSSIGKAIIAQMPENTWADFLPAQNRTSPMKTDFVRELRGIRKTGVAWNRTNADFWSVGTRLEMPSKSTYVGCAILVAPEDCGVGINESLEQHVKRLSKLLQAEFCLRAPRKTTC